MKFQRYFLAASSLGWPNFVLNVCARRLNEDISSERRKDQDSQRRAQISTAVNWEYNLAVHVGDCFSSHATAEVEGRGKVGMSDIQVGDKVLTRKGTYETVYTIDHRHPRKNANFVQIHSEIQNDPIEMTARHMIFLEGNSNPVPASSVKVGDQLQTLKGPANVLKVDNITRDGIYSPLTVDGTIVVNEVVASSYSSLFTDTEWVEVAGTKLMHMQIFLHRLLKPYRYLCMGVSLDLCKTSNERIKYAEYGVQVLSFWLKQHYVVRIVSLLIFVFFVYLTDLIFSPYGIILGGSLCWLNYAIKSRTIKEDSRQS